MADEKPVLKFSNRVQIDQKAIKGEPGTGFEKRGNLGPFECGNCEYFDGKSCGQKDMMEHSKEPRTKNGRVIVGEADCCEYLDRVGPKKESEKQVA